MDFQKLFHLPLNASSHGHEVDIVIYLIHILMVILFIGWGIFFILVLEKFRRGKNPNANYKGTQSHVTRWIEIGVIVFEAVLLVGFSIPFWAHKVNALPRGSNVVELRVVAEQFAWNIHYPGPDGVFGKTNMESYDRQTNPLGIDPNDPNGRDDVTTINQLHLPVDKPAFIHLTSKDVMHSFFLPEMRIKKDIIPGMSIPTWFTPNKTGQFEIACAQLCGLGHYRMKGFLTIHSQDEFDRWIAEQVADAKKSAETSDDFWN